MTTPRIIEFKVDDGSANWEQIPVAFSQDLSHLSFDQAGSDASVTAERICRAENKIVRWNRQGSYQGHYTDPFCLAQRDAAERA